MNNIQKRFLMFLIGCIGLRTLFVIITYKINIKYLPYIGFVALLASIGFLYVYLSGIRKTGGEVFGDKIWWDYLRPVHSILYLMFAFFAITKNKNAWKFLAVDVILGLTSFLAYHIQSGNIKELF